jgi:hypothetical protein
MGGSSGGQTVVQPQPAPAPTASQSAAEYAAALPSIYQASLEYQPKFDAQQLQSANTLAPQYAQLYDTINKQLNPQTYGLQEQLAGLASQNANATQLPSYVRDQYRSDMSAQLGANANSPIGADYVSRGLLNQLEGYRQYYQNLGLSVAGRQPLVNSQTAQQPSQFNVPNQFSGNYQTQMQGYGSYANAARPMAVNQGTPNWITAMQAGGAAAQGIGTMAMMCWVAGELYGGMDKPQTIAARLFIRLRTPGWFKALYIKHGERFAAFIKDKPGIKNALRPLFDRFVRGGEELIHGK